MQWWTSAPDLLRLAAATGVLVVVVALFRLLRSGGDGAGSTGHQNLHRIRELEAEHRVMQRKLDELDALLTQRDSELEQGKATVRELQGLLAARDQKLAALQQDLRAAVAKTHELRQELTDRAAESIRQHVRAEEARTELAVMRAGSDAVMSEYLSLQDERERLAQRMAELERSMGPQTDPDLSAARGAAKAVG